MNIIFESLVENNIVEANFKTMLRNAGIATVMGSAAMFSQPAKANIQQIKPASSIQQPKSITKNHSSISPVDKEAADSEAGFIDMKKIVQIESSGNPKAVNKKSGARGLTQLVKPTWEECVKKLKKNWSWDDAFDGKKNLIVGTYYMNKRIPQMLKYYKIPDTVETRLAAYNWGIGYVYKAYKKYGNEWINYIPTETKNYIKKYNA